MFNVAPISSEYFMSTGRNRMGTEIFAGGLFRRFKIATPISLSTLGGSGGGTSATVPLPLPPQSSRLPPPKWFTTSAHASATAIYIVKGKIKLDRLGNDNRIAWLECNVLLGLVALEDFAVIEREFNLFAIAHPQNMNLFDIRKSGEPAGA